MTELEILELMLSPEQAKSTVRTGMYIGSSWILTFNGSWSVHEFRGVNETDSERRSRETNWAQVETVEDLCEQLNKVKRDRLFKS